MQDEKVSDIELRDFFFKYFEKERKAATEHPDYNREKTNYHLLSKKGQKASQILGFMSKIHGLNSDIEKTHTFIRRFPIKDYYKKNDIDQLEFIKYHYEVFVHKVHTLLEVKKLWLNDFYEIGLKEEDCSWNNLKRHKKILNSPTRAIIDNYFKSFKHIIEFRHLNSHRAFYIDQKNDDLKIDLLIYTLNEKYNINIPEELKNFIPKHFIDYQIKKYRREKLEYIKSGLVVAEKYSEQFITIILKEFFKKLIEKEK